MTFAEKTKVIRRGVALCHQLAPSMMTRIGAKRAIRHGRDYVEVYLAGAVVAAITGHRQLPEVLTWAAVCVGVTALLDLLINLVDMPKHDQLEGSLDAGLRMLLADKCMRLDYADLENPDTHRQKTKAEQFAVEYGDAIKYLPRWTGSIVDAAANIGFGLVLCGRMIFRDFRAPGQTPFWNFVGSGWSLLLLAGMLVLSIWGNTLFENKSSEVYSAAFRNSRYSQLDRLDRYYSDYNTKRYQAGKDIRIYHQQSMLLTEMDGIQRETVQYEQSVGRKQAFYSCIAQLFTTLASLAMYAFALLRGVGGFYTASEVVMFVMSFAKMTEGVNTLVRYVTLLYSTESRNMKVVFDFLDTPNRMYLGSLTTEKRSDRKYDVEFRDVSFRYPGAEDDALRHVNIKFKIGEKLAVVGLNGSGKTTFIKLLCRLYDPTEGAIFLNGIDIRKYSYAEYMQIFSVVFQDFTLFSFSLGQNVAASVEYDREKAEKCLIQAGFGDRLAAMPQGLDTCLYKDFDENGVEISGGEAQKIAIARALYKNAPFIVLDEPTAALDPIAEAEIYAKFNAIVGDKTAIYISHRLSSCRFCDTIVVFDHGQIVQRGSHDELVETSGQYRELWEAQAQYYRE